MAVLGDVRVIPQSLEGLRDLLCETARRLGLPRLGAPGVAAGPRAARRAGRRRPKGP
jgi:hypothetical protein